MKQKSIEWIISIAFSIIGLLFLVAGVFALKSTLDFKKNAVEGVAIISNITSKTDSDGDVRHTVYLSYSVDGEEYNEVINFYSANMRVGKEIKIYYDPNSPMQVQAEGESTFVILFPAMGAIFFIIGMCMLINKIKKRFGKKNLIKTGEVFQGEILDVECNESYSVNGKHPYVINCKVIDITDGGAEYLVQSENIWFNPNYTIKEYNIKSLPVYMSKTNKRKYYICLDQIDEKVKDLR